MGIVCGYKCVGRKKKGSAWWDEEVKDLVKEKRRLFEVYLADRNDRNKEEYKRKNRQVNVAVGEKKNAVDERDGVKIRRHFRENKKLFWSDVNRKRSAIDQMTMKVRDSEGNMLTEGAKVQKRWREYFESLLNVDDGRRAQMSEVIRERMNDDTNGVFEVGVEDVRKAVKKLKKSKSPGIDGITSEMLKYGGEAVLEWLTRMCRICVSEVRVPNDWVRAIIVSLYKGKGDRNDCKNYRGISLLSIPRKVYGRIVIEGARVLAEEMIGDEQCDSGVAEGVWIR